MALSKPREKSRPRPVAAVASGNTGPTPVDNEALDDLISRYETSTASEEDEDRPAIVGTGGQGTGPAPVQVLKNQPLEAAPAAQQTEEESKEFKGEFYPVARPHGHKDEEHKPG
jgi:hypothetical protein